jgi:MFS family permease
VLERLGFPDVGHHRRFVTAIAVDAVGSGVFMPLSMLYFLAVTPLSLIQVGAAISIASAVSLPAGPVIGALVDRLGAKRVLLAGNLLQGLGFAAYLVIESFWAVTLWTVLIALGRTAFWGSYGNIVAAISLPGEREKWFGFLGALRNVGFALGGLAAGVTMTVGTDLAFSAVVAANAAS